MTEKEKLSLGEFIERIVIEKGDMLAEKHNNGKKVSKTFIAKNILNVSPTWFCSVINGDKNPNDEMLIRLASFLEIDEHILFKNAKRVHPEALEAFKKQYLGDYYHSESL